MPNTEGLIIPVRFDVSKIPQALAQVGTAGKKAGDDTAKSFQGATDSGQKFFAQMALLQGVEKMGNAASGAINSMGQALKESGDYAQRMAKSFADLRQSMQEVAALRGQANTNAFVIEEVRKAAQAGLTPQEQRDFQAQFLNFAGAQVGPQAGAKLTTAQGEEYGSRIARMFKASGLKPAVGAELGGSILEQVTGPQEVDKLMKDYAETFQILQKGRVPLEQAIAQTSQVMSFGISPQESAKMFAIVSPAARGEEGTSVMAALRAVQEMQNKGTGAEFGVTQEMTKYEAVKSFSKNIEARRQALIAGGASEELASNKIQAELFENKIAADAREARGLVRGFARQGIQLGGFERYERVQAETPANFEDQLRRQYEASAEGKAAMARARDERVVAERGIRQQALKTMMDEAHATVVESGELERPEGLVERAMTKAGEAAGQGTREEQITRALTAKNIKQGLQGYAAGRALLAAPEEPGGLNRDIMLNAGRAVGTEFLAKMANELERMRKLAEEDRDRKDKPALSAPPPSPDGRGP